MKFAKLFNIGEEQLLVWTEVNPEMDTTLIHHVTDTVISRIDTRIEIKHIDHENLAVKYLEEFAEEQAVKIFAEMQDMLKN